MNEKLSADEQIAAEEAKAVDEINGKTPPTEEPKAEEKPEAESTKEEIPIQTQTPTQTPTEEDEDLSKFSEKAQKRFRELNEKAQKSDQLEREIKRLKELVYKTPVIPEVKPRDAAKPTLPWLPGSGQTDEILTPEELEKRTRDIAERTWQENNQKKAIADKLNLEIMRIEDEYEELRKPSNDNPNSKFNEDLVKKISDHFLIMQKVDPATSLLDYTRFVMGLKNQGAEDARRKDAATLNRQAAEQAIDPSGIPSKPESNVEDKIRGAKNSEDLAKLEKLLPHA